MALLYSISETLQIKYGTKYSNFVWRCTPEFALFGAVESGGSSFFSVDCASRSDLCIRDMGEEARTHVNRTDAYNNHESNNMGSEGERDIEVEIEREDKWIGGLTRLLSAENPQHVL
jgi:hypothetical protein